MKMTKENKGITIISLIITIIIMLILAGVTIKIATDGGLFDKAKEAVGQTENAIKQEQQLVNEILDEYFKPDSSGDNTVKLPEGLKAGDYVNYIPTTGTYKVADGEFGSGYTTDKGYQEFATETGENALKWRVLSIDEETGEIELVAATAAQVSTPLYLQGADGYNHVVDILNDLCEALYSNTNGATARSINVEDINIKTTYDYTTVISPETGLKYGDTKQLSTYGTGHMHYPNLYSQEIGYGTAGVFNEAGLSRNEGEKDGVKDANGVTTYSTVTGYTDGNTAKTDPYITHTAFYYNAEEYLNTNLGVNTAPLGLIKTGTAYWLASRFAQPRIDHAIFGFYHISEAGYVSGIVLLYSNGGSNYPGLWVRPVVTLSSNATLTKDTENSTDEVTYWNIEYEL